MSSLFKQACVNDMHLSIGDAEAVDLASSKAAVKTLTKAVKAWKEQAKESSLTARPMRGEKEKEFKPTTSAETGEKMLEKTVATEKTVAKEVLDMGHPVSFPFLCLFLFAESSVSALVGASLLHRWLSWRSRVHSVPPLTLSVSLVTQACGAMVASRLERPVLLVRPFSFCSFLFY